METLIWIAQILLAVILFVAGTIKLTQSRAKLVAGPMASLAGFSDAQVKGIGAIEVLATVGLILPAAIGVVAVLTPIAACGVILLMVAAARTHFGRGEMASLPVNLVLAALALFVVVERFGPHAL